MGAHKVQSGAQDQITSCHVVRLIRAISVKEGFVQTAEVITDGT